MNIYLKIKTILELTQRRIENFQSQNSKFFVSDPIFLKGEHFLSLNKKI
jgi:hypothetical protein